MFADFQPKIPDGVPSRRTSSSSATSIPSSSSACWARSQRPELVVCDTMNYWIQGKKAALLELLDAGGRPDGERQRGAGAERRLEHPPRRPVDPRRRARAGWSSSRASTARCSSSRPARSTCPRSRSRPSSIPPAPATRSPAGSWRTWRAPARSTEDNMRRAMVYGAAMGSYAVEQFGIRGFERIDARRTCEARVRAFQDLTHVPLAEAAAVTRQYAEAGVDLEGAEAAKARIGRAGRDAPGRRSASARSARSAAWCAFPTACGGRRWCSAPTASAPRCSWRSRPAGSTPSARIWSTTASTTSWSTAPLRSPSWTTSPDRD